MAKNRMTKAKRETSMLATEKVQEAWEPLRHADPAAVEAAIALHREQTNAATPVPEHIRIIQRLGIKDAARGFNDTEIATYVEAMELAERERSHPEDFISRGVAVAFGRQGGVSAIHDNEAVKATIREILRDHQGPKKLKGSEILLKLESILKKEGKPVPQKTKFYGLLHEVQAESPEIFR